MTECHPPSYHSLLVSEDFFSVKKVSCSLSNLGTHKMHYMNGNIPDCWKSAFRLLDSQADSVDH
jgi:hypothetical protein